MRYIFCKNLPRISIVMLIILFGCSNTVSSDCIDMPSTQERIESWIDNVAISEVLGYDLEGITSKALLNNESQTLDIIIDFSSVVSDINNEDLFGNLSNISDRIITDMNSYEWLKDYDISISFSFSF